MITVAAIVLMLVSLIIVFVSWIRYGWNQSYWVPFGAAVIVTNLLIIGALL